MSKLDKLGEWKNPGKVFITGASAGIGVITSYSIHYTKLYEIVFLLISYFDQLIQL